MIVSSTFDLIRIFVQSFNVEFHADAGKPHFIKFIEKSRRRYNKFYFIGTTILQYCYTAGIPIQNIQLLPDGS